MAAQLEKLMTVPEVAELLNVSPSTVYEWTHIGYIPCIRLGVGKKRPCVRFKRSVIAEWVQKKELAGRTKRVPV